MMAGQPTQPTQPTLALPKGGKIVTLQLNFSPLSFSPVGEMRVTPNCQRQVDAGYSVTVIDWWVQVSLAL